MNYVGIDLHKKTIVICVVDGQRKVLARRRLFCNQPEQIVATFRALGAFEAVIEATASYEWLFELLEPLAAKLVLAHPGKLRVIAESVKKTDKLDAQVLAEFLALGMIPPAYRPTPRQRQHRRLVRQRVRIQQRRTSVRCRLRFLLADYNADRADLFTAAGLEYLEAVPLSAADQFVRQQLVAEYRLLTAQLAEISKELTRFAKTAPAKEAEARAVLRTIPGVGPVTAEVVVAELGDVERFGSQKKGCAYAGLAPIRRESAGKRHELRITKQGSRILRWALVESAWQLVRYSRKWQRVFEALAKRRGKKRAIIAVARRLLAMMLAMLKTGTRYDYTRGGETAPHGGRPASRSATEATTATARTRRRAKARAATPVVARLEAEPV